MENYDKDDALITRPDEPDCARRPRPDESHGCRGCRPPRCPEREPGESHGNHGCRPPRCPERKPGESHGCRPPRCREDERRRREAGRPCGDPYGTAQSNCAPPCLGRLTGERPCCAARRQRGLTARP